MNGFLFPVFVSLAIFSTTQVARAEATAPEVCFEQAARPENKDGLGLTKQEAITLCSGAKAAQPVVNCYKFVSTNKVLNLAPAAASLFCRHAENEAPVECLKNSYKKLQDANKSYLVTLNQEGDVLALCKPLNVTP